MAGRRRVVAAVPAAMGSARLAGSGTLPADLVSPVRERLPLNCGAGVPPIQPTTSATLRKAWRMFSRPG
jgi:hypothetical protein